MWRPGRRVSWSMVALLVSLTGALALGLMSWVPSLLGRDSGIAPLSPGLLRVETKAQGVVTLGEGRAVGLDGSGLRITHDGELLFQTVRGASPISALIGEVRGEGKKRTEEVEGAGESLLVERLDITPGTARWSGDLVHDGTSRPAYLEVRLVGERVTLTAAVEGVDAVVVHTAEEQGTYGRPPVLPDHRLHEKAWWLPVKAGARQPAFITRLGTSVAVGPGRTDRALDMRLTGHADLHVWSDTAELTIRSLDDR